MANETKLMIQIDDVVREMTKEEQEQALLQQEVSSKIIEEHLNQVNARKSAYAKLAKLGLTEEEIASL
jgi:hypothetical protein